MKVVHVITRLGRDCGGPVRSVQGLVAALGEAGVETWLLSMTTEARPWLPGVTHFRCANAKGYGGYVSAMRKMIDDVRPDLVHLHNIWNPDIHAAAAVCRRCRIPYISSPRGSLEPWSLLQKRLKKRIAMWLYQRFDLNHAVALHATSVEECEQFRNLGLKNPVMIVPNGVNLPDVMPVVGKQTNERPRLLFLSRIHRKKGLVEFVKAWEMVRPKSWQFEIVGFDEDGSLDEALSIARQGGFEEDIIVTGPLEDDAKWQAYAQADAFVLPTHSENFGIVVAEALYSGLPVLTTTGTPWRELQERHCGWWVNCDISSLAEALRDLTSLPSKELREMGSRGRLLVEEKYSWPAIAKRMRTEYESLLCR